MVVMDVRPGINRRKDEGLQMSTVIVIAVLALIGVAASGQVVYSTDYKSEAQVKVYVTKYKSEADLVVYKTTYKSEADANKGIWFFTNYKSEAKKKIWFTDYKSEADIVVYFTTYKSEAGWKKNSKKHMMY